MILLVDILLLTLGCGIFAAVVVFSVECFASLLPARRRGRLSGGPQPSVAVLIPAHDEELMIRSTIASVLPGLTQRDRLVVVADNCSDRTAAVARRTGAEVIERHHADRRGKGYALRYGIDYLRNDPPDVLVVVDADTSPEADAIANLARDTQSTGRPMQGVYLLDAPHDPSVRDLVSCFAIVVKNHVRPLGLARAGLPCPLTGSGMAIPWAAVADAPLEGGNLVEDMQLGVDLAIAGYPPRLCADARVRGRLPERGKAAASQRRRWEHGHIGTLLKQTPRLLVEALKQRRAELLGMALDLAVPPLSLLSLLWAGATTAAIFAALYGASWAPLLVLGAGGAMFAVAVLLVWGRYARKWLPLLTLLAIPLYVVWKIPLYLAFAFKRQRSWVRTARDEAVDASVGETNQ